MRKPAVRQAVARSAEGSRACALFGNACRASNRDQKTRGKRRVTAEKATPKRVHPDIAFGPELSTKPPTVLCIPNATQQETHSASCCIAIDCRRHIAHPFLPNAISGVQSTNKACIQREHGLHRATPRLAASRIMTDWRFEISEAQGRGKRIECGGKARGLRGDCVLNAGGKHGESMGKASGRPRLLLSQRVDLWGAGGLRVSAGFAACAVSSQEPAGSGLRTSACAILKAEFAQLAFEGRLELLQVGIRRPVACLLGGQPHPASLIDRPIRTFAVAEGDLAAHHRAGAR